MIVSTSNSLIISNNIMYLIFKFQVVIGQPGKGKEYPQMTGIQNWKKALLEKFPKEEAAIDKFLALLKVVNEIGSHDIYP